MYDRAPTRYTFPLFDYGGGADREDHIIGPKGKKGFLYDYGCYAVVEAFAAGTATPQMAVGIVGNRDAYGEEFDFGALAIAGGGKSIRTTYHEASAEYAALMVNRTIAADTAILVTHIAGTGSGLTGQATPFVDIIWDL